MDNFLISTLSTAFVIAFIPAFIAKNKGRNFLLWYIYGFAFFIIALIHSLFMKDHSGIQCPACKEWIKEDASVCKYCHTVLTEAYGKNKEENKI